MSQRRYKRPDSRVQGHLFPNHLDDYISADNPVRAIDAYVDSLDLAALGYERVAGASRAGQPPYDPRALLKLYLYGYQNRLRSSRGLARECQRNVELMWLLQGLKPSHQTIAEFRRSESRALRATQRDFILLCRDLGLFGGSCVAIDGSFFKANASAKSFVTEKGLQRRLAKIEQQIADWHTALDQADTQGDISTPAHDADLKEKIAAMQARQAELQAQQKALKDAGKTQLSRTDPDARLLNKRGQSLQGFNVQVATDDRHHLIAASDVTCDPNDLKQLKPMSEAVKQALAVEQIDVLADAGYHDLRQIRDSVAAGITPYISEPPQRSKSGQRFSASEFVYDAEDDRYRCPGGHRLTPRGEPRKSDDDEWQQRYQSQPSDCRDCPLRDHCLGPRSQSREVWRNSLHRIRDQQRQRNASRPDHALERSALAEHPFGTLKCRAGWQHFLVRGLEKVRGEWSLMALSYNLTRAINVLGLAAFIDACQARRAAFFLGLAALVAARGGYQTSSGLYPARQVPAA